MRTFVLRARSTPVDGAGLLAEVGRGAHSEILAHVLMNAVFVAQSHRTDVDLHLVLERTSDYSRAIRFRSAELRDLGGIHEQALLARIAAALDASRGMGKEDSRCVEPGITVRTIGFERLVRELAVDRPLFVLDRRGMPIREQELGAEPCFVLTDHLPMPRKSFPTLERLGATRIRLGPRMLLASQCVVLVHQELDLREA